MKVTIKIGSYLRHYIKKHQITLDLEEGVSVEEALKGISVPEKIPLLILVDGNHQRKDYILKEGEVLSVYPPIGGG
ncbi:MAG: MoaD/ThiS family protein [Deltaproteobacteria bacterium]|nr:MAG: MoaD/ThiS family protein [Deltaproteobacteria bacterium]